MLYPSRPFVGLIIGSYSGVPQIHLQLEALRRHHPELPVLVHDDASPDAHAIRALCEKYHAAFSTNEQRLNHTVGDMTLYLRGLEWAKAMNMDLVVKFSRRWIPLVPWLKDLEDLAFESQGHCFSGRCTTHGFGFRTECVAMHVKSWLDSDACAPIREEIGRGGSNLVEAVVHRAAGVAEIAVGHFSRLWQQRYPAHPGCGCYVDWAMMGSNRTVARADVLWHEWSRAHEYHRALLQWGINDYSAQDFINPQANIRNV